VSSARVDPNRVARPALLFGAATAFVAAVDLVRELRPRLLLDAEPGWAAPRLLLGLTVVAGAAAAAALAAAVFHRLTRTSLISGALEPLPFGARAALGIAVVALGLGRRGSRRLRPVADDPLPRGRGEPRRSVARPDRHRA
jgi:hypothetical protein